MSYTLYRAFRTYVMMIESFGRGNVDEYRIGASAIRNGLPQLKRGEPGFKDVLMVKQFVEQVLVEEEEMLEIICEEDAAATFEALSPDSKNIIMKNPDEINRKIFKN